MTIKFATWPDVEYLIHFCQELVYWVSQLHLNQYPTVIKLWIAIRCIKKENIIKHCHQHQSTKWNYAVFTIAFNENWFCIFHGSQPFWHVSPKANTAKWICTQISYFFKVFNSSPPSGAYMHQWIGSALVMACRQFGAKLLSKPMLAYCQLDPYEQTSVKF